MKAIIKEFNETGACVVDVKKVVKAWTNFYTIIQYGDKYTLVNYRKNGKGSYNLKVQISSEQAQELITALDLKCVRDTFFGYARTYKTQSFIDSEIQRLNTITDAMIAKGVNSSQREFNEFVHLSAIIHAYRTAN